MQGATFLRRQTVEDTSSDLFGAAGFNKTGLAMVVKDLIPGDIVVLTAGFHVRKTTATGRVDFRMRHEDPDGAGAATLGGEIGVQTATNDTINFCEFTRTDIVETGPDIEYFVEASNVDGANTGGYLASATLVADLVAQIFRPVGISEAKKATSGVQGSSLTPMGEGQNILDQRGWNAP